MSYKLGQLAGSDFYLPEAVLIEDLDANASHTVSMGWTGTELQFLVDGVKRSMGPYKVFTAGFNPASVASVGVFVQRASMAIDCPNDMNEVHFWVFIPTRNVAGAGTIGLFLGQDITAGGHQSREILTPSDTPLEAGNNTTGLSPMGNRIGGNDVFLSLYGTSPLNMQPPWPAPNYTESDPHQWNNVGSGTETRPLLKTTPPPFILFLPGPRSDFTLEMWAKTTSGTQEFGKVAFRAHVYASAR